MDKPAIHDICLTFFFFKQIWFILSVSSSSWVKNIDTQSNKDITLHDIDLGDHIVKTTVHKSYTVSVIVACNLSPMPIDMLGLVKISSSPVRVEVRLQLLVNDYVNASIQNTGNKQQQQQQYLSLKLNSKIPSHMFWIVKMWHFGQDALASYSGEKFDTTCEDILDVFHHIYPKRYGSKNARIVRKDVQQYSNKPLEDAFIDKLEDNDVMKRI